MADYIAAHIRIGGPIPQSLVPALCQAITSESVSLEYGDADYTPQSEQDLLDALQVVHNSEVLQLCDDQARWGEFDELEKFLIENGLSFDRFHEGKYDIDPSLRQFRPESGCRDFTATTSEQITVPLAGLLTLRADLAEVRQLLETNQQDLAQQKLRILCVEFDQHLVEPEPMPDFHILTEPVLKTTAP